MPEGSGKADQPEQQPAREELVLTRIFDAPRELVFRAWTDPHHMAQWWGPRGFTTPHCELDPRPGGAIRLEMRAPDGTLIPTKGVFREINAPERLVMTLTNFEDAEGHPQLEVLNTVTLAEHEGVTRLTLHVVVVRGTHEVAASLATMEDGWNSSLDRLAGILR